MFEKTMVRGLLTIALAATLLGGTAMADTILPTGLAPGSEYQILFVTSDRTTATSSSIAVYDSFVTQEADQSPTLKALGVTWTAVASTPTFSAGNASSTTNVPIYDTHGDLLESSFPSLFSDSAFSGPQYNQTGLLTTNTFVWAGSWPDGTPSVPLGGGIDNDAELGYNTTVSFYPSWWISDGDCYPVTDSYSLYALSSPVTVPTPNPPPSRSWVRHCLDSA